MKIHEWILSCKDFRGILISTYGGDFTQENKKDFIKELLDNSIEYSMILYCCFDIIGGLAGRGFLLAINDDGDIVSEKSIWIS